MGQHEWRSVALNRMGSDCGMVTTVLRLPALNQRADTLVECLRIMEDCGCETVDVSCLARQSTGTYLDACPCSEQWQSLIHVGVTNCVHVK